MIQAIELELGWFPLVFGHKCGVKILDNQLIVNYKANKGIMKTDYFIGETLGLILMWIRLLEWQ